MIAGVTVGPSASAAWNAPQKSRAGFMGRQAGQPHRASVDQRGLDTRSRNFFYCVLLPSIIVEVGSQDDLMLLGCHELCKCN